MKLRIRGNSLRLRLTRTEVAALAASGEVVERIEFAAGNALVYRVSLSDAIPACQATLDQDEIAVSVPATQGSDWVNSETVSIEAEQPLAGGRSLRILIEKDFACLVERPGEDDSDAYPHPDGC